MLVRPESDAAKSPCPTALGVISIGQHRRVGHEAKDSSRWNQLRPGPAFGGTLCRLADARYNSPTATPKFVPAGGPTAGSKGELFRLFGSWHKPIPAIIAHLVHAQFETLGSFSEFVVIAHSSRTVVDVITAQD